MQRLISLLQRLAAGGQRPPATPALAPDARSARAQWGRADWQRIRAPERVRDHELSAKAARWMSWLPTEVRPDALARSYPRIVNSLASCWRDVGITDHLLTELQIDDRGDRQGFAPEIVVELRRLQRLHAMRLKRREPDTDDWHSTVPS